MTPSIATHTPLLTPPIVMQTPAPEAKPEPALEKILCQHCKRTATNGIKCQGMCVADSDY